jgi:XTP/dITP diphosphohydrolase
LLAELAKRGPDAARTGRFRCALVLARDARVLAICEGSVVGEIVRQARGSGGFGYDSLFQPNEFSETFAELPAATKMKQFLRGANLLK